MVRLSVIYRRRAVPLVWSVIEHGNATVAYEVYNVLGWVALVAPLAAL